MSISIVNIAHVEIRRLAVAGSDVASGDSRMKRLAPDIRKMGETVPVFARLADSIEQLVNPGADGDMASKLLEAATLTNALLYTQGVIGVEGEINVPENSSPDLPTAASYQTISRVKEAKEKTGGKRRELFEEVYEEGRFVDLRLLDTFLELLYSPSNDVANLVCEKILPTYGEAILPQLLSGYKVKGKVGDGRRLELIGLILKENGTNALIDYSRSKSDDIRVAAFKMLVETNSEPAAAADRIIEALRDDKDSLPSDEYYIKFLSDDLKPQSELVCKLIQEGDSYLACYQQKNVDQKMAERLNMVLTILYRNNSASVQKFFERCKGQPDCLVKIVELTTHGIKKHGINIKDLSDRKNLLSALRSIVHSSFDHGTKGLPNLICLMAHAAILENDREAMDIIVRFASDPSSPIYRSFTHSIDNYTQQQLREKADFSVTRQLFEMALDIATPRSAGTSMSLLCNALWVMQKDNTGLPVDREMNEKFLEKCLPNGPIHPIIYAYAAYLYVEMNEYDKALECIDLSKKHNYRGYDGMLGQIRADTMFEDFRKDERVMKIIKI